MTLTTVLKQPTMTSIELVAFINSTRQEGEAELRHDTFMAKVPKVIGEKAAPEFYGTAFYEVNGAKRERQIYNFPKREAALMAMSYSYSLSAKVYDHMTELEEQLKEKIDTPQQPTLVANPLSIAYSTFITAKAFAELFGVKDNAALISANSATQTITGVSAMALLGITHLTKSVQEFEYTPTELGKQLDPILSPQAVNKLLEAKGLQSKINNTWHPTKSGLSFAVLLDTTKKNTTGSMITQLKWKSKVLEVLK